MEKGFKGKRELYTPFNIFYKTTIYEVRVFMA
jgi:hypothetical protein